MLQNYFEKVLGNVIMITIVVITLTKTTVLPLIVVQTAGNVHLVTVSAQTNIATVQETVLTTQTKVNVHQGFLVENTAQIAHLHVTITYVSGLAINVMETMIVAMVAMRQLAFVQDLIVQRIMSDLDVRVVRVFI